MDRLRQRLFLKEQIQTYLLWGLPLFDLAELKAMNHEPMYMKDWLIEVDNFVQMYGKGILSDAGAISHKQALVVGANWIKPCNNARQSHIILKIFNV